MKRRNVTLPELEERLRELREGTLLHISRRDYERLFGLNDTAVGRLRNLARGHQSVASFADTAIVLRKHIVSANDRPSS
jgi:hypothetical protein